ncbi:nuclear protein Es2-domain-containing protein [Coniella lustricola]|uniref:Nuclear protein Es2-domain-containing protein n=1 Tax=Coniella lustricola TaxID=2025994 RepID=A0A2T3ALF2_9PEZI|nr:nuclear protein Es2-domain-containing protein [Coniella lustricola]
MADSASPSTSNTTLARKRPSDMSLMPPPPPTKRIKRPKKVIDEETYTDVLSKIIARDFYPGLLQSETQQEYLDALDSKDKVWIDNAGRRLKQVMTPGRLQRLKRPVQTPSRRGGETPLGYAGDTPMSTISVAPSTVVSPPEIDANMSLGAFQAKYTSEDNESFYKLLDKQNQKRAEKYGWLWRGNKLPSKQELKQMEVKAQLAASGKSLIDDGFENDRLAIEDKDDRPAMPDTWKSAPMNALMFSPDGIEDGVETIAARAQEASRAAPRRIMYENTRMPVPSIAHEFSRPPSPTLSAVRDAIAGRPRAGDRDSTFADGNETPRVNGYAFIDDEEPEASVETVSIIDLGPGDAMPNPFKIQDQRKREDLHHRMVDRIAESKRTSARIGLVGRVENTPVPKFPNSPRVTGGLTPAAQRLWSKIGGSVALTQNATRPFGGSLSKEFRLIAKMGFVDLAIDLAAVLGASRSVASKHIALRRGQLDYYGRTSSVAAALKRKQNGKLKADILRPTEPVKAEAKSFEEVIPEGVNLDSLFRTHRGNKLSPLWKGDKMDRLPIRTLNPWIPKSEDLDEQHKERGSSIPEVINKNTVQNDSVAQAAASLPSVASPGTAQQETSATSALEAQPSTPDESYRETEEIEVPRYPDPEPAFEQTSTRPSGETGAATTTPSFELRESRVPSSRLGRIWNYGGLAAGMFAGAINESFSRVTGGGSTGSVMLSPANMERLVSKLSKMRGAALKLGQMMSFQDSKMLPAPIQEVLQRVQDRADYMPAWQRDRVLTTNLGSEWRELFDEFEEKPIAAASIGQVHRAKLKSNGARVAVKIQFPGVADSINSDLDNLGMLLAATKLLPKGLYLNKTIDNARTELGWECDYEREAQCAQRYRELLATEEDVFMVPEIYPEASGKQVLTMEFMDGVGVTRINSFTQEQRDWIGTQILRLCLREIVEFHFMQTDPNWTNFLFDFKRDRLVLLDFGASREYPDRFIKQYVQLLAAASRSDRETVKDLSEKLGYLTGHESKAMLDAHIASVLTLAEPFLASAPEVYDFRDQTITERVKEQIPVMIRERLAPPPEETYSLHRKLSGAFLLCARLGSRVRCREMFDKSVAESKIMEESV